MSGVPVPDLFANMGSNLVLGTKIFAENNM